MMKYFEHWKAKLKKLKDGNTVINFPPKTEGKRVYIPTSVGSTLMENYTSISIKY